MMRWFMRWLRRRERQRRWRRLGAADVEPLNHELLDLHRAAVTTSKLGRS